MGRNKRRRRAASPSLSSDSEFPDMSPTKPASEAAKQVSDTELTSQHAILDSVDGRATAAAAPALQANIQHALLGEFGVTGANNSGPFEALHAALEPDRIAAALLTRRGASFIGVAPARCVPAGILCPRPVVASCSCAFVSTCASYRHKARIAENLNIYDSVTHDPKFSEPRLAKEMRFAFEQLHEDFKWAARNGRLGERDRNSQLGRFFLRGEVANHSVRAAYEAKLRDAWAKHYA